MSHPEAIHKWTMTDFFQQVVTYFSSTFSLSPSIAPLTLKCFINGNSLIFTPFLWNTIVMREPAIFGEAGEEKEKYRQLFISLVRIRGGNYDRSLHFSFNYFRILLPHFTLMPCNHFFNTKVHKSYQLHQLKNKLMLIVLHAREEAFLKVMSWYFFPNKTKEATPFLTPSSNIPSAILT